MNRTLILLIVSALVGCVKAPEFVMTDRATALEQQAGGSFDELEQQLDRAGVEPRPVQLTPEQLAALGIRPSPLVDATQLTDADRLDALLGRHCVGEGQDGSIVETRDACHGGADPQEVATLIDRVNRARRQLWRWMHDQQPGASADDLRKAWREAHMRNVVCGGWIQGSDGQWQDKTC
jgi:hypothetical protein